jgi:hypothetical protein
MPTLVSELCTPNIQNVRRTHRRQRDYDMAIVQLFRRAAVSAAALDNDNQARRPGLSTEGTRGGVAAVV